MVDMDASAIARRRRRITITGAILCLSFLGLVITLASLHGYSMKVLWTSEDSGDLSVTLPGKHVIITSADFWYFGQPASEGQVTITRAGGGGVAAAIHYSLYSYSEYVETVEIGYVVTLDAGTYIVSKSGDANVEIKYVSPLNTNPSSGFDGEWSAGIVTFWICFFLVLAIIITLVASAKESNKLLFPAERAKKSPPSYIPRCKWCAHPLIEPIPDQCPNCAGKLR